MDDPGLVPVGGRTCGDADGWLHDEPAAAGVRAGRSPKRRCRWCGSQMIWTGRPGSDGAMRCAGHGPGTPSCDRP